MHRDVHRQREPTAVLSSLELRSYGPAMHSIKQCFQGSNLIPNPEWLSSKRMALTHRRKD
jgi:hypothetical protein